MYRGKVGVATAAALALFVNLIGHSLAGDTNYGLVDESPVRSPSIEEITPRAASAPVESAPSERLAAQDERPRRVDSVASVPVGQEVARPAGGSPVGPAPSGSAPVGRVVGAAPGGMPGGVTGGPPVGSVPPPVLRGAAGVGVVPPYLVGPAPTQQLRIAVVPPSVSTSVPSGPTSTPSPYATPTPSFPTSTPFAYATRTPILPTGTPFVSTSTPVTGTATPFVLVTGPTVSPSSGGLSGVVPAVAPPRFYVGPSGPGSGSGSAAPGAAGDVVLAGQPPRPPQQGSLPPGGGILPPGGPCTSPGMTPPGRVTGGLPGGTCGGGGSGPGCVWPGGGAPGTTPGSGGACSAGGGSPCAGPGGTPPGAMGGSGGPCGAVTGTTCTWSGGAPTGTAVGSPNLCAAPGGTAGASAICERPDGARWGAVSGPRGTGSGCDETLARPAARRTASSAVTTQEAPRASSAPSAPADEVAGRRVLEAHEIGSPARAGGLAPLAAGAPLSGLGFLLTAGGILLRRRQG